MGMYTGMYTCVRMCIGVYAFVYRCVSMVHEDMGMYIAMYILYVYKRINILHVCIGVCIVAYKGMFADIYKLCIYIGRCAGV